MHKIVMYILINLFILFFIKIYFHTYYKSLYSLSVKLTSSSNVFDKFFLSKYRISNFSIMPIMVSCFPKYVPNLSRF